MEDSNLIAKMGMYEQQIRYLQEQMEAVESAFLELTSLKSGLEEIRGGKEKEILAQIGRGIFVKAKITSEDLIVDVGGKNFVKKDISGTQKILKEQLKKIESIREELNINLEQMNEAITKEILESRKKQTN
jgi:prefoldin alpha subunit